MLSEISRYLNDFNTNFEVPKLSLFELNEVAELLDFQLKSDSYKQQCLTEYSRGAPIRSIIDQLMHHNIYYPFVGLFEYEFQQLNRSTVFVGKVLNYPFLFKQIFAYVYKYWKLKIK